MNKEGSWESGEILPFVLFAGPLLFSAARRAIHVRESLL